MKNKFTNLSITITFLVLGVFIFSNKAYAETEVSNNITEDTTWALANSPYIVTGKIHVYKKLIIEPGVIIKFNKDANLNIERELNAIGTEDQRIIFTSNVDNPSIGNWDAIRFTNSAIDASFAENPSVGNWDEIGFTNSTNENYLGGSIIKYAQIEYAVYAIVMDGSSPYIENNIIRYAKEGIHSVLSRNAVIKSNTIYNISDCGIFAAEVSNFIKIADNEIMDSGCGYRGGPYDLIINNVIKNNRIGINGGWWIKQNIVKNNDVGIAGGKNIVSHNTISQNKIGLHAIETSLGIHENNIFNNTDYNIESGTFTDIDATKNYFGTTNISSIENKIYDYYDNGNISLGKVNYKPFATAELKFDGIDTFSQPSACTSWTFSDWSTCQSNSTKTRSVASSLPSGCSGGSPVLTQSCTYTPPTCTSWVYSNWGICANNQKTRTITSSQPANCTGGNPVLNQSCVYASLFT